MAQLNIRLSEKVLRPDTLTPVRGFAERTDWHGLPTSTHSHAGVISVVLRPPDLDTSMADKGLLLLAAQRTVLYLDWPDRSKHIDVALWLSCIQRIHGLAGTYQLEDYDAFQLYKDKMELSIELMTKARGTLRTDRCVSEVLCASANELGESAGIQTRDKSEERMKSALAIAQVAKQYSFDDNSKPPALSLWAKITSGLLGR
jgi:hypothetical protein